MAPRNNDEALEEYYIFSVVRNPWDRFVSVSAFLNIPTAYLLQHFQKFQEIEEVRIHSRPKHFYTHCLGQPYVNRICRFERIQEDMALVLQELGLELAKIPLMNRSNHLHYSSYYTDTERDKVASLYANDVALYGYAFSRNFRRFV